MTAGPQPVAVPPARELRDGDWRALGPDAARVRQAVFVQEQEIPPEEEWDRHDAAAVHAVVFDGAEAVATGRLLAEPRIGRMAVLAAYRREGLGGRILEHLVARAAARGDPQVELAAQSYVCAFYERHGFERFGEPFDDAGIPHQWMRRRLG
jgi:predicted GNAT family N-acyltransferase